MSVNAFDLKHRMKGLGLTPLDAGFLIAQGIDDVVLKKEPLEVFESLKGYEVRLLIWL